LARNFYEQFDMHFSNRTPPVKENSALLLDIDGTILDMARAPDAVVVPDDLKSTLSRLADELRGAVAFVSGRSLATIDRLFAPLSLATIGCHGAEVRGVDGIARAQTGPLSDTVRSLFRKLAEDHPGVLLEDKIYALALHYRLAPEAKPVLDAEMEKHQALFIAENVFIQHGKAVIDARPVGIDKGVGVRALADQKPFRGRRLVFGGDDTTDLDVFRILPELGGRGFSVGRKFPGVDFVFPNPRAVRQWLAGLAQQGLA
jgi:trehalose 6-phosphate phosphatase